MSTLTTQRVVARGSGDLAVEVDAGDGLLRTDMPVARGGGASGPTPGSMMRASVAACLAVGYKQWSEKLNIAVCDIEIELTTEIDMRGQGGTAEVPPGWQSIRWHVRVTSAASDADVERLLRHAESLSPMLDSLHPRCKRVRTFEVRR
jgi:uncharacterized OsmC-like protein